MEEGKKFDVELKQTVKGSWYIGSLKIGADSVGELDKFIDSTIAFLHTKIDKLNKRNFKSETLPAIELNDEEKILFEKLRSMRMDIARSENIPPYIVFHDSVLKRLAKTKPMTKEEMIQIDGIGEKNFDKYGIYFLKVIRDSSSNAENER
ncbi:HRDC domain-containing protein [Candidatus Woesearchaeota archaeon]|nr:HRDC domain-containing protein [Candidatus Woesearchaeota archaeon]